MKSVTVMMSSLPFQRQRFLWIEKFSCFHPNIYFTAVIYNKSYIKTWYYLPFRFLLSFFHLRYVMVWWILKVMAVTETPFCVIHRYSMEEEIQHFKIEKIHTIRRDIFKQFQNSNNDIIEHSLKFNLAILFSKIGQMVFVKFC